MTDVLCLSDVATSLSEVPSRSPLQSGYLGAVCYLTLFMRLWVSEGQMEFSSYVVQGRLMAMLELWVV